ncbi:GMC family oxidoreductase [Rhizobium binxianense]
MTFTHVIVGGGSAGCALAARLSEDSRNKVVLIEAGEDFSGGSMPDDILDTYAGRALNNPRYFWPGLQARRGDYKDIPAANRKPMKYEQARVMGGGSTINGQVALRGLPSDFDRWAELGARGWDWNTLLPYFRRLETDRDFVNQMHGSEGPISIRRIPRDQWDPFTNAVCDVWEEEGFAFRNDMNGSAEDGYAAIPLANNGERRSFTALDYLSTAVRARRNLKIMARTEARRVLVGGSKVTGVEVRTEGGISTIGGERIILSAGALHSPWLLMQSGIGPAEHLRSRAVEVVLDRPAVGANLQDHPTISISSYLPPLVRARPVLRHNYANLLYSSGIPGCSGHDMVMMVICKSAWHAVGARLGTISAYVGKAYSRGYVRLAADDPGGRPDVCFNWLEDERDLLRLSDAFVRIAALYRLGNVPRVARDPFAASFSDKVRNIGRRTLRNRILTETAALMMDNSGLLRRLLIDNYMSSDQKISDIVADRDRLHRHVREASSGLWHPSGTCRMGATDDPACVVDPNGRVIGLDNLYVADASIMPEIPTHNLNIPSIMIGERMADLQNLF